MLNSKNYMLNEYLSLLQISCSKCDKIYVGETHRSLETYA